MPHCFLPSILALPRGNRFRESVMRESLYCPYADGSIQSQWLRSTRVSSLLTSPWQGQAGAFHSPLNTLQLSLILRTRLKSTSVAPHLRLSLRRKPPGFLPQHLLHIVASPKVRPDDLAVPPRLYTPTPYLMVWPYHVTLAPKKGHWVLFGAEFTHPECYVTATVASTSVGTTLQRAVSHLCRQSSLKDSNMLSLILLLMTTTKSTEVLTTLWPDTQALLLEGGSDLSFCVLVFGQRSAIWRLLDQTQTFSNVCSSFAFALQRRMLALLHSCQYLLNYLWTSSFAVSFTAISATCESCVRTVSLPLIDQRLCALSFSCLHRPPTLRAPAPHPSSLPAPWICLIFITWGKIWMRPSV